MQTQRNKKLVLSTFALGVSALVSACSQTVDRTRNLPRGNHVDSAHVQHRIIAQREPEAEIRPELSQADEAISDRITDSPADYRISEQARSRLLAQPQFDLKKDATVSAQARRRAIMANAAPVSAPALAVHSPVSNTETYAELARNSVKLASEHPVSTFSIDVDTGSYANVRRYLNQGRLPPHDAVRVEELLNYFDYAYAPPECSDQPFSVRTEIAPTPWNANTKLVHIGIQGCLPQALPVGSNLVFLVDVSGSMSSPDKLPLVKTALKMLTRELGPGDRVSLVVYAGASGVVLEPTAGNDSETIGAALERLQAGGSTNGGSGIELAYAMARQGWIEGGVNRVLLATDGDFNVGTTRFESLIDLVEEKRRSGVALTTLGFGQGNYNDHLMEQLADAGDGNHAYIDSAQEAYKVLVRQRHATLTTIARDVKIQMEFNPAQVSEYRLIGYENRGLNRADFNNDSVDAGEIGAGHSVTALYEIALKRSGGELISPLRYGQAQTAEVDVSGEIAHLRLRYKQAQDGIAARSKLIQTPLLKSQIAASADQASPALNMSAAVAAFAQLLSGGQYMQGFDYTAVAQLAERGGDDRFGDRAGFRQLINLAESLSQQAHNDIVNIGG